MMSGDTVVSLKIVCPDRAQPLKSILSPPVEAKDQKRQNFVIMFSLWNSSVRAKMEFML